MKAPSFILSSFTAIGLVAAMSPTFAADTTVNVTTNEWKVSPDKTTVKAGKVTFVVTNKGKDDHEVEIVKIDGKKFDDLPRGEHSSVDEKWLKKVSLDEVEDLAPGKMKTFSVNLTPGNYALLCNMVETEADGTIEAHYHMGMSTAFKVE